MTRRSSWIVAAAAIVATIGHVRAAAAQTIELVGANGQRRTVGAAELKALPSIDVDASAHNVSGRYRGVALGALLRLVGQPAGDSLRGPALAQDVLVEAADGYHVVFAPAELDAGYTDRVVMLAYMKNGAPLDASEGPFRVVVPGEKRPARWVRAVVRVRVRQVAP